jgi:hypothetical protein
LWIFRKDGLRTPAVAAFARAMGALARWAVKFVNFAG